MSITIDLKLGLIEAKGRELNDLANFGTTDNWDNSPFLQTYAALGSVALQNYTQNFVYDQVGNMTSLQHAGSSMGSYTRTNTYSNTKLSQNELHVIARSPHPTMVTYGKEYPQFELNYEKSEPFILTGGGYD